MIWQLASLYFKFKHLKNQKQPPRCSLKKVFLKVPENLQENTCLESLFNKFAGLRPKTLLQMRLQQVFYCEFCEIFENKFFTEHLQVTASNTQAVVTNHVQIHLLKILFRFLDKDQIRFYCAFSQISKQAVFQKFSEILQNSTYHGFLIF